MSPFPFKEKIEEFPKSEEPSTISIVDLVPIINEISDLSLAICKKHGVSQAHHALIIYALGLAAGNPAVNVFMQSFGTSLVAAAELRSRHGIECGSETVAEEVVEQKKPVRKARAKPRPA